MHKSRLAGFIIDCDTDDLDRAAEFWAGVLGAPTRHAADPANSPYVELNMPAREPYVEVQKVDHPSRVHIDIEADNIDAEVARQKGQPGVERALEILTDEFKIAMEFAGVRNVGEIGPDTIGVA